MRRTARPWPVAFTVEGLNIERFVRQAGEEGIRLTALRRPAPRRLTACLPEDDLPLLQDLALRGGWKLTVGARRGAGHAAEWLRARWLLAALIPAAMIALLAASQFMWRIDVENGGTYTADIRSALAEWGVEPPLLRKQVNIGELRNMLEWRYPRVAWFECGWRGSALVIRPVEGTLPRADGDAGGPCDVVAARDGIVHAIVTYAGTPVVQPGDFVRAGEVLIRGEERTAEDATRPVAARGSVTARVWEGASVRLSATEILTEYTGNTESVWTLRTPWFDLWPMGESAFAQYDTAVTETPLCSFLLPVILHSETRMEAEITRTPRDVEELQRDGEAAALRKLHEKLRPEESPIDIWGNCSMIDDGTLLSVAICELHVEIGRQSATGMTVPGDDEP